MDKEMFAAAGSRRKRSIAFGDIKDVDQKCGLCRKICGAVSRCRSIVFREADGSFSLPSGQGKILFILSKSFLDLQWT
jgi:hypothetical protein